MNLSQISFSSELTVTPTTIVANNVSHFESTPNTSTAGPSRHFQNSTQEVSFNSGSFDFGSPVDLSAASPMTSQSAASLSVGATSFNKDDIPVEKGCENTDSTRDLIMSAIGVMKSRKARPDTKRISSWIHRRYNRPILAVTEELERLVTVGELARVDYKGSASFRITTSGAKMRRKRKNNKPLGRAPANNPVALGGVLPPMFSPNPDGSGPQLTLHQLVIERLTESTQHTNFDQGLTIPTQYIAKAVEETSRDFSRATVLGNLDLILEREVAMGLFQKIDSETYRLIPQNAPPPPPQQLTMTNVFIKEESQPGPSGIQIFPPNNSNLNIQQMAPPPPPSSTGQFQFQERPPFIPSIPDLPFKSGNSFPPPGTTYPSTGPSFSQSGPIFSQSGPNFSQAGPNFSQAGPNFSQAGPNFQSSGPSFQTPRPNFQPLAPNFSQTGPNFQQTGPRPNFQQSGPNFSQPGPNFSQAGPNFVPGGMMPMSTPPPLPPSTQSLQQVSQSLLKGCTYTMPSGPPTGYPIGPPGPGVVTNYPQSLPPPPPPSFVTQTSIDKSDEQMKNDLIRSQLSKMATKETKAKSPNKRTTSISEDLCRRKGEPQAQPQNNFNFQRSGSAKKGLLKGDGSEDSANEIGCAGAFQQTKKRKLGIGQGPSQAQNNLEYEIKSEIVDSNNEDLSLQAINGRKKKSRKNFDPAVRSNVSMASPPLSPNSNTGSSSYWSHDVDSNDESKQSPSFHPTLDVCHRCSEGPRQFPKCATEAMLRCKDCSFRAHPGCLKFSEPLAQRALSLPWQCQNCKSCSICQKSNNEDCMLLTCESCQQAFHLSCHLPPLSFKPAGRFECFRCQPSQQYHLMASFQNGGKNVTNGFQPQAYLTPPASTPECDGNRFPPIGAPFNPPHTGVLPTTWSNFETDLDAPDISNWMAHQISNYFAQHGFGNEVCKVFIEQELDGRSLLLMQRTDVVTGLGLKLGPALKAYSHVKRFQLKQICNKNI